MNGNIELGYQNGKAFQSVYNTSIHYWEPFSHFTF
jgi:hypothetical protein